MALTCLPSRSARRAEVDVDHELAAGGAPCDLDTVRKSSRKVRFANPAKRVFARLDDRAALAVVDFLNGVAAAHDVRDGWSVLPGGLRIAYRATAEEVVALNISEQ